MNLEGIILSKINQKDNTIQFLLYVDSKNWNEWKNKTKTQENKMKTVTDTEKTIGVCQRGGRWWAWYRWRLRGTNFQL